MKNMLYGLRYAKANSYLIRKILRYFYKKNKIYRVPFGPLRGIKMRYHKTINFHAVLGLWELDNFHVLSKILVKNRLLKDFAVICDVGANIGSYSMWFSKLVSENGIVFAFEPSPTALLMLRENINLNNITNVTIEDIVCADRTGNIDFFIGHHHHTSSVMADWARGDGPEPKQIKCRATTLDDFFYGNKKRRGPDLIKMDIEGGATLALKGCNKCVSDKRPLFLIESHSPQEDSAISTFLLENNYQAYRINDFKWVDFLDKTYPDKKGVWGTLLLCPNKLRKNLSKILL